MTAPAHRLGQWVLGRFPHAPITHLKLQKLCFYCYGGALAFDLEGDIGEVVFEAWPHGPVSRELYNEYRENGSNLLPYPSQLERFTPRCEEVLDAVLRVYGRLTAWQLREQSHLEKPWVRAQQAGSFLLPALELKAFFREKYASGRVECPEYVAQSWSLRLDGIPTEYAYPTLYDLGRAVSPE